MPGPRYCDASWMRQGHRTTALTPVARASPRPASGTGLCGDLCKPPPGGPFSSVGRAVPFKELVVRSSRTGAQIPVLPVAWPALGTAFFWRSARSLPRISRHPYMRPPRREAAHPGGSNGPEPHHERAKNVCSRRRPSTGHRRRDGDHRLDLQGLPAVAGGDPGGARLHRLRGVRLRRAVPRQFPHRHRCRAAGRDPVHVVSLVGIFVFSPIVNALAPTFAGQQGRRRRAKVVAYSATSEPGDRRRRDLVPWLGGLMTLGAGHLRASYLLKSARWPR